MTATPATSPFLGLIEPYEWNLLALARRQFLIEAFTGDLDRITRGKLFRFRNHSVWLMLLDTRDMLVRVAVLEALSPLVEEQLDRARRYALGEGNPASGDLTLDTCELLRRLLLGLHAG
jgi:hypothetical protein